MSLRSDAAAVKSLLNKGTVVFHLVHQFNVHPADYAHSSWIRDLVPPALYASLTQYRRGVSRLSKILLRHHDLHHDNCYDFDQRWWRFALLPAHVLIKLTLYCGLSALHRQIAAIVDKRTLAKVKNSLNETDYVFAVKRSPLLIGQHHGLSLRWDGSGDIGSLAQAYGTGYFLSHFKDAPRAVTARLAFKFPRPVSGMNVQKLPERNGWQLFKRILIHEIEPRWQPLFS